MLIRPIALILLLASAPLADTIHRNDGTKVEDITITSETLAEVSYKEGRRTKKMPSSEVLRVDYTRQPSLVEEAMAYLKEGDASSALSAFEEYVGENVPKVTERRDDWAPAFATFKTIGIYQQLGELDNVVQAADRMIKNFGDSRYLPEAYLLKAKAQVLTEKSAEATRTLDALAALVSSKKLSKRWDLECRLARARADNTRQGERRRSALSTIKQEAGSQYPAIMNRALVAEGESYLIEAESTTDATKSRRLRESAQRIFEGIVKDKASDEAALAGAHTGLGDCLFFAGAASDDKDVLKRAAMNYLRVITLHKSQSEYVAKALFFAMRCFELMGEKDRVRDMKRDLLRLHGNSKWAKRQEVARAR